MDTPAGYQSKSLYFPSAPNLQSIIPCSSDGFNISAPAPSPNKTQVDLSSQSISLVMTSAPITNAHLELPDLMNISAVESAYTKPEHAASRLKAGHPCIPKPSCINVAVFGKT